MRNVTESKLQVRFVRAKIDGIVVTLRNFTANTFRTEKSNSNSCHVNKSVCLWMAKMSRPLQNYDSFISFCAAPRHLHLVSLPNREYRSSRCALIAGDFSENLSDENLFFENQTCISWISFLS